MYVEFDSDHTVESAYKKLIKQSAYGDSVISSIKNEQIVFKYKCYHRSCLSNNILEKYDSADKKR